MSDNKSLINKRDWSYGGCSKTRCAVPSTPKERKEAKIWKKEDARFYRQMRHSARQSGTKVNPESSIGWKSGEVFNWMGS